MKRRAPSIKSDGEIREAAMTCDLVSLALYGAHIPVSQHHRAQHPTRPFWKFALEVMAAIAIILAVVYLA
jgi:hypothetical protein